MEAPTSPSPPAWRATTSCASAWRATRWLPARCPSACRPARPPPPAAASASPAPPPWRAPPCWGPWASRMRTATLCLRRQRRWRRPPARWWRRLWAGEALRCASARRGATRWRWRRGSRRRASTWWRLAWAQRCCPAGRPAWRCCPAPPRRSGASCPAPPSWARCWSGSPPRCCCVSSTPTAMPQCRAALPWRGCSAAPGPAPAR
mmetsp:Transcript_4493/g.11232  ORF Transcript_4493/g.11232 Transcript_4493/m.11232 type:complete len:205 (+) Transcript_4493:58-672(+)